MPIETIKFSQMTPGGNLANDEKTPGLLGGANVLFNNPWTFLASGSTAERPVPSAAVNGRLRFNTDTLIYEYYDTIVSMWVELSGSGTGTVNPGPANSVAFYAANGTDVSPTNSADLAVLVTNNSGFPSFSTTLPDGLAMGTPASLTLTNATGLPSSQLTGGISVSPSAPIGSINISNSGNIMKPNNTYFWARVPTNISNVTGDGTLYVVPFGSASQNIGGSYDTTTGIFTAPVAGAYAFYASVQILGLNNSVNTLVNCQFLYNSSYSIPIYFSSPISVGGVLQAASACTFYMNAGDRMVVYLIVSGGASVVAIGTQSTYSAYLIG